MMEVAKDERKHTNCTAAVVRRAQPEVGGPPNASQYLLSLKEVEPFEQGKTMRIHELCYNMPKSTYIQRESTKKELKSA